MSDSPTDVLEARIQAMIERIRTLARERNALLEQAEDLRSRLDAAEGRADRARIGDVDRLERENGRLRTALEGAVRELREESGA